VLRPLCEAPTVVAWRRPRPWHASRIAPSGRVIEGCPHGERAEVVKASMLALGDTIDRVFLGTRRGHRFTPPGK